MNDTPTPAPDLTPEPAPAARGGIAAWLMTNFLAGIITLTPLVVTLYLVKWIIVTVDGLILGFLPVGYQPSDLLGSMGVHPPFQLYGMGMVVGFFAVVLVGMLGRNFLGQKVVEWGDSLLNQIPGVRSIYVSIKQLMDTVTSTRSGTFREVVLVEFPRKGMYMVGFITGVPQGEIKTRTGQEMVNVFIPTTPNPTSGYLAVVARSEIIPLKMTVDQGLKMVISAGIVTPDKA